MVGILDIGGGMRGAYSAGVFDFFLDQHIQFDYCLGVSAGSANIMSYLAGQKGRNILFYTVYNRRRDYMSVSNVFRKGCYLDLNYVYSVLSNDGGEKALDYDAAVANPAKLVVAATRGSDGRCVYFTNRDLRRNDMYIIKASSALPFICQPQKIGGDIFYDGGISNPIPLDKCFEDGCEKVVLVLNRPSSLRKEPAKKNPFLKKILSSTPAIYEQIMRRHIWYNQVLERALQLEKEGRVLILAPEDTCGVGRLTRNPAPLGRLYGTGYLDAKHHGETIRQWLAPQ